MFACLYLSDFPVQAALRCEPEQRRELLTQSGIVILEGSASNNRVISLNAAARQLGIELGMTKLQAQSCGSILAHQRNLQNEDAAQAALMWMEPKNCLVPYLVLPRASSSTHVSLGSA
jgi:protein ImuB